MCYDFIQVNEQETQQLYSYQSPILLTVVGDYINTMKMIFLFKF